MVGKKNLASCIENNIFMINKNKFIDLTKTNSYSSSASYLGICLLFSFLLMSLTLFYLYYIIDGLQINDSLNEAIVDAGFSWIRDRYRSDDAGKCDSHARCEFENLSRTAMCPGARNFAAFDKGRSATARISS